jgi:hypothetical protein
MRHIVLIRDKTTDQGTYGVLKVMETGWQCQTIELPWRSNKRGLSCIRQGIYNAEYVNRTASGKFTNVYYLQDVPGRSGILVHAGNVAGDITKGFESDVEGCILVGKRRGILDGQQAVLSSRVAMRELNEQIGGLDSKFMIWDKYDA